MDERGQPGQEERHKQSDIRNAGHLKTALSPLGTQDSKTIHWRSFNVTVNSLQVLIHSAIQIHCPFPLVLDFHASLVAQDGQFLRKQFSRHEDDRSVQVELYRFYL
jgi:hypothetical protein